MSLFSFQGKVSLGDRLPNGKLDKPAVRAEYSDIPERFAKVR